MRTLACFYCGKESERDEYSTGQHIGIRYCTDHKSDAHRDVRAYLHRVKKVRTQHALVHPILGSFLNLLKQNTYIRRTSGAIEDGWTLQHEAWSDCSTLNVIEDTWFVPMIHRESETIRYVSLITFLEPELVAANAVNNPDLAEQIQPILTVLNDGIYKEHYDAVVQLRESTLIQETDGVISCGGVRVFLAPV
jgi:hypothetical protein